MNLIAPMMMTNKRFHRIVIAEMNPRFFIKIH